MPTALQIDGPNTEPPHILLAVDPGKATGYCIFTDGIQTDWGDKRSNNELTDFLETLEIKPDVIVIEKYVLFRWKAEVQSGSRMEVAQAEGIVESYAHRNKIKVHEQSPQVMTMAKMWSGVKMPGNHDKSHHIAAFLHGYFWLVRNNMVEIRK